MADPQLPDPPVLADAADRGRLVIKDRVVETVAERAALDVASVVRVNSGLNPLSSGLPRADVTVTTSHARVSLTIATSWDRPLYDVAAEVRETVAATITRLTDLAVDTVNVTIGSVDTEPTDPDTTSRRRDLQ